MLKGRVFDKENNPYTVFRSRNSHDGPDEEFDRYINERIAKLIQEEIEAEQSQKKNKSKKDYKEENIMKAHSELKKDAETGKYQVETEMNIKEGLDKKTKTALQKSIIEETKKRIMGGNVYYDDSSSSDEEDDKKEELIKKLKALKEKVKKKPNKYIEELLKKYNI
jgi:hypothetical protein